MIGRRNFSVTTLAISVAEFVHMTAATSNISRKYARLSRRYLYRVSAGFKSRTVRDERISVDPAANN